MDVNIYFIYKTKYIYMYAILITVVMRMVR